MTKQKKTFMGLGSQNNQARKDFQTMVGKNDWKSKITTPAEANALIAEIKKGVEGDPNADFILATYAGKQIKLLTDYINHCGQTFFTGTLKEYCARH